MKKKLDSLYNQEEKAAQVKSVMIKKQEGQRMAIATAQMNDSLKSAQLNSVARIRPDISSKYFDPEVRCNSNNPTINEVSGVMPNVEFVIRGKGLGKNPGSVDVLTGGHKFPAIINSLNS